MAIVEQWSRTVAIDILFLLNIEVSFKNCISVSAQYWLNNKRFCITIGNAHRTSTSHLYCIIPNGAPKCGLNKKIRKFGKIQCRLPIWKKIANICPILSGNRITIFIRKHHVQTINNPRLHLIHARLHFIHARLHLIHTRLHLIHTRLHLIHNSATFHPRSATSHPQLGYISSTLGYISSTLGYFSSTLGYISSTLIHF